MVLLGKEMVDLIIILYIGVVAIIGKEGVVFLMGIEDLVIAEVINDNNKLASSLLLTMKYFSEKKITYTNCDYKLYFKIQMKDHTREKCKNTDISIFRKCVTVICLCYVLILLILSKVKQKIQKFRNDIYRYWVCITSWPFPCTECDYRLCQVYNSNHTGERTIKCIFYEIEVILISKCLHTGKMLFSCTKCDYSFCQPYMLEHICKWDFNLLLNNYDIKILLCEIFHAGAMLFYYSRWS